MTQAFYYSNTAVAAELGAGISNSATSLYLNLTPSGYPANFPFKLVLSPNGAINEGQAPEVVYVSSGSGTAASPWVVSRGEDGSTAAAWTAGATIQHEATAGDFTLSRVHEAEGDGDSPHGLPASAWLAGATAALYSSTLAVAAASVTISDIAAGYSHLILVVQARCTEASVDDDYFYCTVNGDTGANYSWTDADGSSHTATTSWGLGKIAAASLSSPAAGGVFAVIPNYAASTLNKMFFGLGGAGNASHIFPSLCTGFYTPSSQIAISSLTLTAPASSDFVIGSYFGLYGML